MTVLVAPVVAMGAIDGADHDTPETAFDVPAVDPQNSFVDLFDLSDATPIGDRELSCGDLETDGMFFS